MSRAFKGAFKRVYNRGFLEPLYVGHSYLGYYILHSHYQVTKKLLIYSNQTNLLQCSLQKRSSTTCQSSRDEVYHCVDSFPGSSCPSKCDLSGIKVVQRRHIRRRPLRGSRSTHLLRKTNLYLPFTID